MSIGVVFKEYPEGAISSLDEFQAILDRGVGTFLYYAHGLGKHSSVGQPYEVTDKSCIKAGFVEFLKFGDFNNECHFSLVDSNIAVRNAYNDHFVFTDKDLAQSYIDKCLASEEQEAATQAHWAWCAKFERRFSWLWRG